MVLGVRSQFRCKRSAAPAGRAAGAGNLGSDPENARFRIGLRLRIHSGRACRSLILFRFAGYLMRSGAALSPRRATYFSLLRQRNLRKRKATLVSASPSLRSGATCGAQSSRGLVQTRCAQTSTSPIPSGPPLLGAFTRVGGKEFGNQIQANWLPVVTG